MKLAVIASEDQNFFSHFGIDFVELRKAISSRSNKKRGASTITQQTAKNLFLWSGRSYIRKAMEAGLAILMELLLSKQRILEIYLNIAQTGPNPYGVGIASQTYFNKNPIKLNQYESARIAAVLPNPNEFSVNSPSEYVLKRQNWILKQMKQLGKIQTLGNLEN